LEPTALQSKLDEEKASNPAFRAYLEESPAIKGEVGWEKAPQRQQQNYLEKELGEVLKLVAFENAIFESLEYERQKAQEESWKKLALEFEKFVTRFMTVQQEVQRGADQVDSLKTAKPKEEEPRPPSPFPASPGTNQLQNKRLPSFAMMRFQVRRMTKRFAAEPEELTAGFVLLRSPHSPYLVTMSIINLQDDKMSRVAKANYLLKTTRKSRKQEEATGAAKEGQEANPPSENPIVIRLAGHANLLKRELNDTLSEDEKKLLYDAGRITRALYYPSGPRGSEWAFSPNHCGSYKDAKTDEEIYERALSKANEDAEKEDAKLDQVTPDVTTTQLLREVHLAVVQEQESFLVSVTSH
ncbi:unnamed protein product, partial [Amoebophrya sp. A25]